MKFQNAKQLKGTLLKNKYRIGDLIGVGSFGTVHSVTNTHNN